MGIQIFDRTEQTSFLTSQVFSTELITDIGAGSTVTYWGEGKVNLRDAGLFAEQRFEYAEQYYLTLGLRNDYASSVGKKAPSIFYPSASFAIRLDRYGWLPTAFNLLKLRLAYGESGQLPGPRDPIPLLWGAANGGYGAGADLVGIGNTELKPETVKEFELGFETEFLTNYSAEFSYYHQNASNSIIGRNYAPSTGMTATGAPFNIGAMKNWGIESLFRATPLRAKNMELGLSLIWNYQTNEVTDLGGAQPIFDGFDVNVIKEGLAKHEFYTQKVIGALYDNDGNYTGPKIYETPDPTDDDRVSFGNPIPSHTGSFSVNFRFLTNVNLYILCDWALDRKIYNSTDVFATRWANNKEFNRLANLLGRAGTGEAYFTEPDPNINPLTPGTSAYNEAAEKYAKMDWRYDGNYVEDADFFKLREISISYSFINLLPMLKADRYIRDLTLGLSARNLFTSTPYTGADAEINSDGSRSLSRGSDFLTLQNPRVYNLWLRLAL
jgi:outer membrane receptor protein involved in Fe transport